MLVIGLLIFAVGVFVAGLIVMARNREKISSATRINAWRVGVQLLALVLLVVGAVFSSVHK